MTVEHVARRAGIPLPVADEHRAAIEAAISDALAEVTAYLGQSPVPVTYTEHGVTPDIYGRWRLTHEPVVDIEEVAAEIDPVTARPTGRYTVVYRAGLDPEGDPAYGAILRSYVAWSAAHNPMVRRIAQEIPGARLQASVNVEGQGVTFESLPGGPGQGGTPTLESLEAYRRLTVGQPEGIAPHPLDGGQLWWW